MSELVKPIHDEIRRLRRLETDADWNGEQAAAAMARREADRLAAEARKGALWCVEF